MPAAYAHYRFGRDVCRLLAPETSRTVLQFPELFQIGLHGPDIFFYHNPLGSSEVNRLGHDMHEKPALSFFKPALSALNMLPVREAGLAYLYGFVCHFALDSTCHPYVEDQREETGITHLELESEFDRGLMQRDGLNPLSHFPAGHIIPSSRNAEVIAAFFPSLTADEVMQSLRSMRTCNRLLLAPHLPKRLLIQAVFTLSGKRSSMQGLLINRKANPACRASNRKLAALYRQALPLAASLIQDLTESAAGTGGLDPYFRHDFD